MTKTEMIAESDRYFQPMLTIGWEEYHKGVCKLTMQWCEKSTHDCRFCNVPNRR